VSSKRAPETIDDALTPRRAGPYELLLKIASGGMATVFLARKRGAGDFQRTLALKLTHAHLRGQSGWAEELIEEAKLATRIRHPNVVQVLDVEDDPAGVFLVMEYVEGDTLSALSKYAIRDGRPMPRDIALRILLDALAGLHAAHELCDEQGRNAGLVHRDFTPQNILVGLDGVARLTDFGVAKAETRTSYTTAGAIKGKTGYMAPEQVHGQPLDRRADIWAAGVVAWEVLAGQRLYPVGEDAIATLVKAATHTPPRISSVVHDFPRTLDDVIASALVLDRQRRFATANAFREALLAAANGEVADPSIVGDYVEMVAGSALEIRRTELATQSGVDRLLMQSDSPPPAADDASMMSSSVEVRPTRVRTSIKVASLLLLGAAISSAVFAHTRAAPVEPNLTTTSDTTAPITPAAELTEPAAPTVSAAPTTATIVVATASASSATTSASAARGAHAPTRAHHRALPPSPAESASAAPVDKPLAPTPYE
jgi:serine/threonine protein kinase